ncbi:hypothetical protein PFDG_04303 [Plasmodium falciparum Dd2]|uniref:Uncharacterized protein n=1 Tax=Plasmodium falciparum (isolate Dd2) TaxID=57267 RepID=A0A0L7M4R7_PLAF4|nr:hypothetical protein PFDG_04303 [Plasmodium falciparum Dd2]
MLKENINEEIDEQYNGHKNNDECNSRNNNETIYIQNHSRDKGIQSTPQKDDIEYHVDLMLQKKEKKNIYVIIILLIIQGILF